MKYMTEIRINLPRAEVVEQFVSSENLHKWQPGLVSITRLGGEPGQEGARSELVYEGRKGELVITETISLNKLPDQYNALYISRGVHNKVENRFLEEGPETTLWRTVNTFRFKGMMKLMAPFMKQAFIHNTMLSMDRFKLYVENPEETKLQNL